MADFALLIEAEKRGIIPADKKALLDEARNRGLAPSAIDFDRPDDAVRTDIAKLPERARNRALNDWADRYVAKEREQGGIGQAIDNTVRSVARGTFVGPFLDEITAGTNAAAHTLTGGAIGAPYDETLAYQRAKDRAFDKANPVSSTALKLAGGVAGGVASIGAQGAGRVVGAAVGGPLPFAPAATPVARIGQGIGAGAAYGAAAGAGEAEGGLEQRMEGAARGGTIGAFLGGGLGSGAETVRGVRQAAARQGQAGAYDQFTQKLGDTSIDDLADMVATGAGRNAQAVQRRTLDIVGEEMQRAGGDHAVARPAILQRIQAEFGVAPSTAATNVRNLTAVHRDSPLMLGEYPAVAESNRATRLVAPQNVDIADVSQISNSGVHDLTDYLANNGGRAADRMRNAVGDRQMGMQDWMQGRLQAMAPGGQTLDDAERMLETVRQGGRAAYQAAHTAPINPRAQAAVPLLLARHQRRAGARAGEQRDAIERALREFEVPRGQGPMSLQQLQDARQSVRGMITRAERTGEGHIVAALQPLYRDMTRIMSRMSPQWAQANRQWRDLSTWDEALAFAQRMPVKAGPGQREALAEFQQMAPQAQDMIRIGWLQQQFDRMAGLRDTHDVSKLFDKREMFNMVRALFGDADAVSFARAVRDAEVAQRSQAMLGNSATHRRGQMARTMDADLGIVAAAQNASRDGVTQWLTQRLMGLLTNRRNVPLADIVATPMTDVFAVARHLHNARQTQQRLQRVDRVGPLPLAAVRAGATVAGEGIAPRR